MLKNISLLGSWKIKIVNIVGLNYSVIIYYGSSW